MSTKINIVLHKTIYPSNIGAAARAMGNMGIDRLILVSPLCKINSQAHRAAVGCQKILEQHKTYYSWEKFYQNENEGLRIGFTARSGKKRPSEEAESLFARIRQEREKSNSTDIDNPLYKNIYLIFGREDSGLSADDVEFFHQTCTLKTYGDYTSLNLSQAILLAAYIAQKHLFLEEAPLQENLSVKTDNIHYPKEMLKEWLEVLGFDLSSKKINAFKVLNKLILKNEPSPKELKVLESVLQQNIRKLREITGQ